MKISLENFPEVGLDEKDIKLELSVALYKRSKFSIGQAFTFAGIDRIQFLKELANRNETVNYDIEDLNIDLVNLKLQNESSS
jgi:predicted HTH domain antitoxin